MMIDWNAIIKKFQFSKSSYLTDILKLIGGMSIAQALPILASPIITRLYDPRDFGLSALYVSITSILSVVVCLSYEEAIMLPKNDDESSNILALSLLFAALISALILPFVIFGQQPILHMLNATGLAPYIWLLPISIFISGGYTALTYWITRTRHFGSLSIAKVVSSIGTTVVQLGAGLTGYATGGSLIIAGLVGSAMSTLILARIIWHENSSMFKISINRFKMKDGLIRYKKFPIYYSWSALSNTITWQLPTLLLSMFFSATTVGYYALGTMVLTLPTSLIGSAISQVFFQRCAKTKFDGSLSALTENTIHSLAVLGIYPMLLLSLIGEDVFIVVFGAKWAEAGIFAQILALWIFVVFITSPISPLVSVLELQRFYLSVNIINLASRGVSLIVGGMLGNARIALLLFSLTGIVIYAGTNVYLIRKTGGSISRVFYMYRIYLACCIPLLGLAILSKLMLGPRIVVVIGFFTIIFYYILIKKIIIYDKLFNDTL